MIANPEWIKPSYEPKLTPEQQAEADWLTDFSKRLGRFYISAELLDTNPKELMQLFAQMIILRCEYRYDCFAFEFSARSELFEVAELNQMPPIYKIGCHKEGGKFTWTATREK